MKKESGVSSFLIKLLMLQSLCVFCIGQDYDFFYFVLQWPGSRCDTLRSCCYPTTGKPDADFVIRGFWPYYKDGSYPANCDPDSPFDESQISDLVSTMQQKWPSFDCPSSTGSASWAHEWEKHGTCSESVLDQHAYFKSALDFKSKLDILQALKSAGIRPDGEFYSLRSINDAIKSAFGFSPGIECVVDEARNSQLYQIYFCIDASGSNVIQCPVLPRGRCSSNRIEFPSFSSSSTFSS